MKKHTNRRLPLLALLVAGSLIAVTNSAAETANAGRNLAIEGENEESPRELYIIPWQDAPPEVTETEATKLLFDDLEPVDPEEFRRQIQYYTAPFEN